jgi:hypothetical protein
MPKSGPCGLARRREGLLAQDQDEAVQFAVERGDAFEIGFGERRRRQALVGDRTGRLGDRQLARIHRAPL